MAISTCRECDAPIGGLHHTPLTGNRAIDISMTQDTTRKGHCLTSAQNLTLAPERTLNLQETLVLRALLHCCLLATSLRHFQEVSGLYWENTVDPLSYFKRQLDFDLQHLASHFHKNVDDIVVVLMKIWQNVGAAGDSEVQDPLLQQKNSRSIWERNFVDVFIKPVLEVSRCKEDC